LRERIEGLPVSGSWRRTVPSDGSPGLVVILPESVPKATTDKKDKANIAIKRESFMK
jgi:hypothetical protein